MVHADCNFINYRALDFEKINSLMKESQFIDLRNVYEPETLKKIGFRYGGVGLVLILICKTQRLYPYWQDRAFALKSYKLIYYLPAALFDALSGFTLTF